MCSSTFFSWLLLIIIFDNAHIMFTLEKQINSYQMTDWQGKGPIS
jgi:hypothetical protein